MNALDWTGFDNAKRMPTSSDFLHVKATWTATEPHQPVSIFVATTTAAVLALQASDDALERLTEAGISTVDVLKRYVDEQGNAWSIRAREETDADLHADEPRMRKGGARPFTSAEASTFSLRAVQVVQLCSRIRSAGFSLPMLQPTCFVVRQPAGSSKVGEVVVQLATGERLEHRRSEQEDVLQCGRLLVSLITGIEHLGNGKRVARAFGACDDFANLVDLDLDVFWPLVLARAVAADQQDRYLSLTSFWYDLLALRDPERAEEWDVGQLDRLSYLKVGQDQLFGRNGTLREIVEAVRNQVPVHKAYGARHIAIRGEAGVGKSALLRECARQLEQSGAAVFMFKYEQGTVNADLNLAFTFIDWAFKRLHTLPQELQDDFVADLREQYDPSLLDSLRKWMSPEAATGYFEAVRSDTDALEHKDAMGSVMAKIVSMFTRVYRPIVAIVDDVQWMPAGDNALLQFEKQMQDAELITICCSRTDEDGQPGAAHYLDTLGNRIANIVLSPLTLPDIAEWVADALYRDNLERIDSSIVTSVASHLMVKCGGNPFLVCESFRYLHESGAIAFDWERLSWRTNFEALVALQPLQLLRDRLVAASEDEQRALTIMDVLGIGGSFYGQELAVAAAIASDKAEALLGIAQKNGFITIASKSVDAQNTAYRFLHDLIQQAVAEHQGSRAETDLLVAKRLLATSQDASSLSSRRVRLIAVIISDFARLGGRFGSEDRLPLSRAVCRAAKEAMNAGSFQLGLAFCNAILAALQPTDMWQLDVRLAIAFYSLFGSLLVTLGHAQQGVEQTEKLIPHVDDSAAKVDAVRWHIRAIAITDAGLAFEKLQTQMATFWNLELRPLPAEEEQALYGDQEFMFYSLDELDQWSVGEEDAFELALLELLWEAMWLIAFGTTLGADHMRGFWATLRSYMARRRHRLSSRLVSLLMIRAASSQTFMHEPTLRKLPVYYEWGLKHAEGDSTVLLHVALLRMNYIHRDEQLSLCEAADALVLVDLHHALSLCCWREADFLLRSAMFCALFSSKKLDWLVSLRDTAFKIAAWLPSASELLEEISQMVASLTADGVASLPTSPIDEKPHTPLYEAICKLDGPLHTEHPNEQLPPWHRSQLPALQTIMALIMDRKAFARQAFERFRQACEHAFPAILKDLFPFLEGLVLCDQLVDHSGDSSDLAKRIESNLDHLDRMGDSAQGAWAAMHALLRASLAAATSAPDAMDLFDSAIERIGATGSHLLLGLARERCAAHADDSRAETERSKAKAAWREWGAWIKLPAEEREVIPNAATEMPALVGQDLSRYASSMSC